MLIRLVVLAAVFAAGASASTSLHPEAKRPHKLKFALYAFSLVDCNDEFEETTLEGDSRKGVTSAHSSRRLFGLAALIGFTRLNSEELRSETPRAQALSLLQIADKPRRAPPRS